MGNLLATFVLFVLALVQSEETFQAWGWRIPFLLSAVLVFIGLYIRLSIEDSPVFKEAQAEIEQKKDQKSHIPILEVFRRYPKEVFCAMGMRLAENTSYYIFTIIVITFVTTYDGQDRGPILQALLIGSVVHFVWIPLVALLSDKIGRKPMYIAGAIGVGAWTFAFFPLVTGGTASGLTIAVVVGLMLHALMYAPQAAFFSELFGTSVRYTGASVGYQLASIAAGAIAPIIALQLLGSDTANPNTTAVGIYVSITSLLTVIAVLAVKETRNTSLRHDRVVENAHD
jgi:MFS family permease